MNIATQTKLPSIRWLITTDMILVAGFSLLLLSTSSILADAMDLPVNLLRAAGAILVPWTLYLATIWKRPRIPRGGVLTIIVVNAAWVCASVGIATGAAEPNMLGNVFILTQATGVAALAICQYLQWKSMPWAR